MWIVKLAIDRPYTFVVVAILLAMIGVLTIRQMSVDIFPNINIPVVSVIWSFAGLSPEEMEQRIISISERAMTTVTSDIEHLESVSLSGIGIIRVYLHPGADMGQAVALMSSINQSELIDMPPGITPPAVVAFSATDVPVLQLGVSSKILTEAQLYDYGLNFIRTRLATVGGASLPLPYGGKQRDVMIDLYPDKMLAKGIAADDVVNALGLQNVILPAGIARFGTREFPVRINGSPLKLGKFNDIPIRQVNNATIYLKDIGHAHDGYTVQTNIVRIDGKRATLMNVLRAGGASTFNVVHGVKAALPFIKTTIPKSLDIKVVNDQSQFVRGAITQVITEALAAAVLTGLLMLALLGSWRSTVIVATSIPLSVLTSIIGLGICVQTLNTMTLGGLSLAVGMLVDDATVEVENIHRNLALNLPLKEAVLTSAEQVALPAFVSTLSICIVFVPVALLTEPARSLFVPLGMAVVFAMLASYFLSRTLVPVMSAYLLKPEEAPGAKLPEGMSVEEAARKQAQASIEEEPLEEAGEKPSAAMHSRLYEIRQQKGYHSRLDPIFDFVDSHFNALRARYHALLDKALQRRKATLLLFIAFYLISACLIPFIGQDFFPAVDAGQMRLHLICPVGTRVDETEQYFARVETAVRRIIPENEIVSVTLNMGTPASGLSLCYGDNTNYTEFDGEMLITLDQQHHGSTFEYQRRIRAMLRDEFPMVTYYFQPADITTQILNAGLQAPIDIQVTGLFNREKNFRLAQRIRAAVSRVPGAVDVIVRQPMHAPQINIDVDRTKAIQLGLAQRDIAGSVLTSLASSFQTSPSFWVNPDNGVNYTVTAQTPLYRVLSTDDIIRTVITGNSGLLYAAPQSTTAAPGAATAMASSAQASPPAMPVQVTETEMAVPPAVSAQSPPTIQNSLSALLATSATSTTTTTSTEPTPTLLTTTLPSTAAVQSFTQSSPTTTSTTPTSTTPAATALATAVLPSTTTVPTLTQPSTQVIPSYLNTVQTSDLTPDPTTIPQPGPPQTVPSAPSPAVTQLTQPSTLTYSATGAVADLTTPSIFQIPSYATTVSSPTQVGTPASLNPAVTPNTFPPPSPPALPITSTVSPAVSAPTTTSSATSPSGPSSVSTTPTTIPSASTVSGAPSGHGTTPSQTNGLGVYSATSKAPGVTSLLMNMSSTRRTATSAMVSHYNIQPVFDVFANTQDRDLGGVAQDVQRIVDTFRQQAPVGTLIYMRGQADSMKKAFEGLILGIAFALILIYLLLAVNFQSWLDPLIILMAIPGALSGIVWALFLTQTTFSVPALMGAIMGIGVGSANSILMVNFANEQLHRGHDPVKASSKAGLIRFRPVLMTAMAMIVGMLPMATGLGEGGGQNAPLGRAVIGGLLVATVSTLFFVPIVYSLLKTRRHSNV